MAEAGFYHVGSDSEPDLVRCYYCRRELDGWEPTDIPWDEHKRRECPYISLGKIPQNLTIEDTFDLEAARKCIIVVRIDSQVYFEKYWRIWTFQREAAKREVEKFREYAKDQKGKIQALGAIQGAKKRGRKKKTKYWRKTLEMFHKFSFKIDNINILDILKKPNFLYFRNSNFASQ